MTHHRIVVGFALALVAAAGCKGKGKDEPKAQSFREGMEILCAAGQEEELQHVNPAERQAAIAAWIAARLTNPEAIELFTTMAQARPC